MGPDTSPSSDASLEGHLAIGCEEKTKQTIAAAGRNHEDPPGSTLTGYFMFPTRHLTFDLPAGGRRLIQRASGYRMTVCRGEVISENGEPTGALPGRLLRGPQAAQVGRPRWEAARSVAGFHMMTANS